MRLGALGRVPRDFYPGIWDLLHHCRGIVIGDKLERRNRLESAPLLSEKTPGERNFASLVEHLLGKTREPSAFEAGLSTFGVGAELPAGAWRGLVDQLIFDGLLREDPNEGRPLIGLGDADAVRAVYRGERRVEGRLVQRHPAAGADTAATPGRRRRDGPGTEFEGDPQLFATLRAWRRAEAVRQKAPPYVIFSDRTLAEIATARPADAAALSRVSGVGHAEQWVGCSADFHRRFSPPPTSCPRQARLHHFARK
jgi:ATP-dependent DNA helicase RecQ